MLNGTDPVASNDSMLTTLESDVQAPLLANDSAVASGASVDTSSVQIGTGPANGTLTHMGDGVYKYTPDVGFTGLDSFTYTFEDTLNNVSNTATVSIDVQDLDPPTANLDTASTEMNGETVIDVLANDTSAATIDATSVVVTSEPTSGSVSVDPVTGKVTYTPDLGFSGTDEFSYTVEDVDGRLSNAADVSIDVTNAAPILTLEVREVGELWEISGNVVDEYPETVVINFGGLLAGLDPFEVTESNGDFSFTEDLDGVLPGTITGRAVDIGTLQSTLQSVLVS